MTYNFDTYKKDTLTRPRDMAWSNWKSWKESKIGDKMQGYIADAFFRPEEKDSMGNIAFRAQRGLTIKLVDGTLQNVGVKYLDFVLAATDGLHIGDPITIELDKILPAPKGKNGAKVFAYYGTTLSANADKPTVKQLTDEDRKAGGSKEPTPEETGDEETLDEVVDAFAE